MPSVTILSSLNKAYRKVPVARSDMDNFKNELADFFKRTRVPGCSEDQVRQDFISLLERTWYGHTYRVSPLEKMDLVIHLGNTAASDTGLIVEMKKPDNTLEMVSRDDLNRKALQELLLYYLRERVSKNNSRLRKLVVTNTKEFFIFDPQQFEKLFYRDPALVRTYREFDAGQLTFTDTGTFYRKVAGPAINKVKDQLDFTWFDISKYEKELRPGGNERGLVLLYKVLSPENLLKIPFQTDSNKLNQRFYNELLYIIGLEEVKAPTGTKRIIRRLPPAKRSSASLIEDAINAIEAEGGLKRVERLSSYGEKREDQLYNVALTLVIGWVNRILFLKLLESQLLAYHPDDPSYAFLTQDNLGNFSDVNRLFFQVLAFEREARNDAVRTKYEKVPYLNSSLFEVSQLESSTVKISSLGRDSMPLYKDTVLKEGRKPKYDQLPALRYLLEFLAAYDFASEGLGEISENSRTLINASVLGLVFEKINGHKDGAVFTPGAITMYMCRQTLRRTVIRKFNEAFGWECGSFDELCQKEFHDLTQANSVIDTLRICDPAVGSGHFLVSALNELIQIKYQLRILMDCNGHRIRGDEYGVDIENDELLVTTSDGEPFAYKPGNHESQRIQKMLFEEKRKLIENCLFGVDLNPNAVNICRLRLWIELLKNAYYTEESGFTELKTLPNIDVNIKDGNSLVHRYMTDINISKILGHNGISVEEYQQKISQYKNEPSKKTQRELDSLISGMKKSLTLSISLYDEDVKALEKAKAALGGITGPTLFDDKVLDGFDNIQVQRLKSTISRLSKKVEEKEKFAEVNNAFEWRLEFPEVLCADGTFEGFDAVIGNPPYISSNDQINDPILTSQRKYLAGHKDEFKTLTKKWDLYIPFVEFAVRHLCRENGTVSMIVPFSVTNQPYAKLLRKMLLEEYNLFEICDLHDVRIFDSITVQNAILFIDKSEPKQSLTVSAMDDEKRFYDRETRPYNSVVKDKESYSWNLEGGSEGIDRFASMHRLGDICYISVGMVLNSDENSAKGEFKRDDLISNTRDAVHCKEYIEAKDIVRYGVKNIRFLEYGTERCPGRLRRPTFPELYRPGRILINAFYPLEAVLDEKGLYHNATVRACVPWNLLSDVENKSITMSVKRYSRLDRDEMLRLSKEFDVRYILGVLNSKPASIILDEIRGGDFNLLPEHLRRFPIPEAEEAIQSEIATLVEEILSAKRGDTSADTSANENKIDLLVQRLYDNVYSGTDSGER